MNMPDFDGIEVCKRIRNHVNCPILFLTAKVEDRDKIKGFAAGGDDYIVKPFSIEEIGSQGGGHIPPGPPRTFKETKTKICG